ncbi:uncharacterized protein LOC135961256 [Calliphora vicina]|uniref:uncharacterized protein LOC135961256 n=1 Tax=Calliphora vicina TaxID=7373 RepID=UPI00325B4655
MLLDEVEAFLNVRYVGSTEALWRIYEFPMHYQSHTIIRLDIHLDRQQTVIFREGEERQAIDNIRLTKLLAFFELNRIDPSANQYTYCEVPSHYVWNDARKKWQRRQRGGDKIISRMYSVSPKNPELFHLRLLLLHVCGPKSYEDIRTYNRVLYSTFVAACHARGIASNDNEWRECLNEAKEFHSPKQMRQLFGIICAMNVPTNALELWNEFKEFLCEDFLRSDNHEEIAFNRALLEIEQILETHNLTCHAIGLPNPTVFPEIISANVIDPFESQVLFNEFYEIAEIISANVIDPFESQVLFNEFYEIANLEQRHIIDQVIREVQYHDTGSNVFCLTAHAGCGKTFVQTAIIHKMNSLNLRCIASAYSGIASILLIGGKTLHNVFKIPVPLLDTSVSGVTPNSSQGQYINSSSLIIIDEVSMCPLLLLKVIDRLLRDISTDGNSKNKVFAGKTIFLCGDFRQILPVVPRGSRATLVENCIVSWENYSSFHHVSLQQNMRTLPNEIEFTEFLKAAGNDQLKKYPQYGDSIIEIPNRLIGQKSNIIADVYGDISENILSNRMLNSVILAPTNDACSMVNNDVINRIPGEQKVYHSYDQIISENQNENNNYPVEFLNSLNLSGLPPHKAQAGVQASKSSIRRVIKSCEYLKYLKLQKKPPLNAPRKEKRLQFARDYMVWDVQQRGHVNDWRTVVFTDEKKFNLDGLDGYNYYFHDLRKEKRFLNRHHSREGGVMVWGAITYYGTIDLEFQSAKMTGASYKTLLESAFPKFSELFGPISWILQQDNAPIHTARVVKEFIASQKC